jgi:RNA 2',3'-cyclic 3'-phosphodiesterase
VRLFIAADLDGAARASVADAVERLRTRAEQERRGAARGVAWVDARNLHLTLHFLGEIDDAKGPALHDALAPPLGVAPPRLALGLWGTFPPHGPSRVIWLGVTAGAEGLAAAHAELGARLRAVGLVSEARPFSPHLTVGRVKTASGRFWPRVCEAAEAPSTRAWTLPACTLFQSHLSPAGPTYRALLAIPFAGAMPQPPECSLEANRAD